MYNKEELEIVDYIEGQNPRSVDNLTKKIEKIKTAVTAKYTTRKAIGIKVLESDYKWLKAKALEEKIFISQ